MLLAEKLAFTIVVMLVLPIKALASDFKLGIAQFKRGEYKTALKYFLSAEKAGNTSAQLTYNIASTYFKLSQYERAKYYYSRLVDDEKWGDLAFYNLGIIAEREGNVQEAGEHFEIVAWGARNEKLREMASRKLDGLEEMAPPVRERGGKGFALVSLASGYDDNVVAFPDELQSSSSAVRDVYYEYFTLGSMELPFTRLSGTRLQGLIYGRNYNDFDSYNLLVLNTGLYVEGANGSWETDRGVDVTSARVDGETAYNQLRLTMNWKRMLEVSALDNVQLSLSYLPSYFSGGSGYSHLDGWEHTLTAAARWNLAQARLKLAYGLEYNNREDIETDSTRFSYSPLRHRISCAAEWALNPEWTLSTELSYTNSRYAGENLLEDTDGVTEEKQRQADQAQLTVKTGYDISKSLSFEARYQHLNNSENFDIYTYKRNELTLGLDYVF